jgi:outer membrane protein OmpA-like peptidoglycan-associated protein
MKKFLLIVVAIATSLAINAQDTASIKEASIGFKIGALDFKKINATDNLTKTAAYAGLQFFKGINPHLDLMLNLDIVSLKYPYYVSKINPAAKTNQYYFAIDANLNYKLRTDDKKVVPYLTAGLGIATDHAAYYTAYAPIGGGIQIKANQGSFINISSSYRAELSPLTKMHFAHSISYTYPLKLKDKKPVMLPSAPVSADADNDGVSGDADECPNQSGLAKYHGCPVPDADDDGVNDENDQCPNAAGPVKYHGCPIPDSDKDGINDELDQCPKEKGLDRYQGCPIPDADKDGINDEEDNCPNMAGIMANHGCANLQPLIDRFSSNLKFASGKTILSKDLLAGLDSIVLVMNEYPNMSLAIGGHTDNTGSLKINQKLSEQRALVVSSYLIKKGITLKRVTTAGYADTRPIADNKTLQGRAKNRRTDLIVLY